MMDTRFLRAMQFLFVPWVYTSLLVAADSEFGKASIICKENERQALLALKQNFTDPRAWLSSWASGENHPECCEWEGITCDERSGHVVELSLRNHSIGGIINPSLVELHHLIYLDFSYNYFNLSSIPKFTGSLTHLKYLNLSYSEFQGQIPHELGNLSCLEQLDLGDNDFNPSPFPKFIGSLTHLRYLSLSYAHFQGQIPHELGNLSCLEHLDLSENYFNPSPIPKLIGSLTHLKYLDLSDSNFKGQMPQELGNLSQLEHLDLSSNGFNRSHIPNFISSLTHLRYLRLYSVNFRGQIPREFGNLLHLEYLDLSENSVDGEFPTHLCNLSSLVHLDLRGTSFAGKVPSNVGNLTGLQYLGLGGRYGDDGVPIKSLRSDFDWLFPLKSLKSLHIVNMDLSSVHNWLQQVANISHLQELWLRDTNLQDRVSSSQSSVNITSTHLTVVGLASYNFTSSFLPKFILDICSLRELYLSSNKFSGRLDELIPTSKHCANRPLEVLYLSGNKFKGSVPDLSEFPSLRYIYLDHNGLNGTVSESIGELSKLESFDVGYNALQGVISDAHFSKLSKLGYLDLSFNALKVDVSSDWVPPFQVEELYLASCKLGRHFPTWLRTQKHIRVLDISSNAITDTIPNWFWDLYPNLYSLNLSHNHIPGEIANLALKCNYFAEIDLTSNNLQGRIPSFLSVASWIDLSNNTFSEADSLICSNQTNHLTFLDLSNNQMTSKVPDCWTNFEKLVFLNLANNNLSGNIPSSMGFLTHLQALHLANNRFTGEIPFSINNCSELRFFDVNKNHLSGLVPSWIGHQLQKLQVLTLRSNMFHGSLPSNICLLSKLQLLDVSSNNMSGRIPKCLHKLMALASQSNSNITITYYFDDYTDYTTSRLPSRYSDSVSLIWKGKEAEYKSRSGLVRSIDLSDNNFIGEIPNELMNLTGLISLNLSRNQLTGEIPPTIGQLKSLDFLDLSRNHLSGRIPSQLSQLGFLGVLNLSYNNLSGEIPYTPRLQTFDASSYMGNPELCGAPLAKCPMQQTNPCDANDEEKRHNFISGFYISMIIGFIIGFWGVCGSLVLNKSWRYAYFKFFDDMYDKLYVLSATCSTNLHTRIIAISQRTG